MMILHTIRTRRPQSSAALAKLTKRDFKNVRENVRVLTDLRPIELHTGPRCHDAHSSL